MAFFVLALLLQVVTPSLAESFIAVDLNPNGLTSSNATGVSGNEQVGGGSGATTGPNGHALLWNGTPASAVDLHPSGFDSSLATGNSDGQQSGYGEVASSFHALLWRGSADSVIDLHPSGFSMSGALDISDDQQVGWGITVAKNPHRHALLWTGSAQSVIDLHPNGFVDSFGYDVASGQQVGFGVDAKTGANHALLWSGSAKSVIDLHPSGFTQSFASGVSSGQQVGYGVDAKTGANHAALWSGSPQSVIDLHPIGFTQSFASDVSNGQQVGYGVDAATGANHALLWRGSAQSVIDLNRLLPVGFTSSYAHAVSAEGDVVGWASGPASGGKAHAFVWKRIVSSSDLVTNVTVASGKTYEVDSGLRSGAKVYIDRTYSFGSVPPSLQGATYIRTANDDKFDRSDAFLNFDVNAAVTVYVLHDDRHRVRPSWLSSFADTGTDAVVRVPLAYGQSADYTLSVFARDYPVGRVTLGGNYPDQDVGNNGMYSVAVLPQELEVSKVVATSGQAYQVSYGRGWNWGGPGAFGWLREGARVYADRDYYYTSIPHLLTGATYLLTINDDKFQPGDKKFLTFDINRPATVYVFHDDRHEARPDWLSTFWDTGRKVRWAGGDGASVTMSVFARDFAAGTVELGGNYPAGATGNYGMYAVALVERELRVSDLERWDDGSTQAYSFVPWGLRQGARVYTDRTYVYGQIPALLNDVGYILTANDDKFSPDWRKLLWFRVNKPVAIYIAHDDRYPSRPAWLSGFRDTGLGVFLEDGTRLSLFRKDYPPGYVTLQGNYPDGGNYAMYTILVVDQADAMPQCTPGPDDAFPFEHPAASFRDTDNDGLDDGWEQALAEFYRPLMLFDSQEHRWPTSARWFVQHSSLTTMWDKRETVGGRTVNLLRTDIEVLSRDQLERDPSLVLSAELQPFEPFGYPLLPSDLRLAEPNMTSTLLHQTCSKGHCESVYAFPYHLDLDKDDPESHIGEGAIPGTGGEPDIERLPAIPIYAVVHQLTKDVNDSPRINTTGLYLIHFEYGFSYDASEADVDSHEGDWERLEVYVDPAVDVCQQSGRAGWLRGIKYYRHSCTHTALPGYSDFPSDDGVPKVYVERGKHGFWSHEMLGDRECPWPVERNADGRGPAVRVDEVINLGERKVPIIRLSGETPEEAEDRDMALLLNGYFGEVQSPGVRIPTISGGD